MIIHGAECICVCPPAVFSEVPSSLSTPATAGHPAYISREFMRLIEPYSLISSPLTFPECFTIQTVAHQCWYSIPLPLQTMRDRRFIWPKILSNLKQIELLRSPFPVTSPCFRSAAVFCGNSQVSFHKRKQALM